jgi:membrane-bound lytic murein transglycosylase D
MVKSSKSGLFGMLCVAVFLLSSALWGNPGQPGEARAPDNESTPAPADAPSGDTPAEDKPAPPAHNYPAVDFSHPETGDYARFLTQYSTADGIKYLSRVMQNSVQYRAFIFSELERLGAPSWLVYLPVIESGFTSRAVSRSGAVGVWQFMRNSIGGYNIRINEWIDERRDPWITTTAAIQKLMDNYRELGDWPLALAAYNCGLGATKKAVKRAGTSDYWELCRQGLFRRETVLYVPKFLAIAALLAQSDEYGIDWGETVPGESFTTIAVSRPVDMNVLARETGVAASLLSGLNPALYYSITPPGIPYKLRIPSESLDAVQTLLEDKSRILLEYYLYTIKSGDTLFALSLHYGVSVDMILEYNPGIAPKTLQLGKKLVIPALREVKTYTGKKDRDNLDFSGSYLVKQGDTLWSIALAHGIQVETLAEKNNLQVNSILKLGKQLRVPIL